jgi:hydroxylaminobenzene mutase
MNIRFNSRKILIHGLVLVLVGLIWGIVVPLTPYPRLALGAHIQFVTNGMLIVLLGGLLLGLPHKVGARSVTVMTIAVWLTWAMALSEIANSWWGTTEMLSIAANQAGATGGADWQELIVMLTHIGAGLGLIVAWSLLIIGFIGHSTDSEMLAQQGAQADSPSSGRPAV